MVPWDHPSPHSKRHFDRFSRFCRAHGRESLYFTMGHRLTSSKLPIRVEGSQPPSNTLFHLYFPLTVRLLIREDERTLVHIPNDISIGSGVSAGLTSVTDRQTDRPRYSVCNNRPHLPSTVTRHNKVAQLV